MNAQFLKPPIQKLDMTMSIFLRIFSSNASLLEHTKKIKEIIRVKNTEYLSVIMRPAVAIGEVY